MHPRILILFLLSLLFMLITGCSGGKSIPVTPLDIDDCRITDSGLPVAVSGSFTDGTPSEGSGALGVFNLIIDKSDRKAELIPLRNTALTDVLEVVDITHFLQLAPCIDCAMIQSVSLDIDGNIIVSIGIKHPFGAGDPTKPITGRNRGDLHVFNIEGTIVSNSIGQSFPGTGISTSGVKILNADGYSPYLDKVLDGIYPTDADIHPYILHFGDYSAGNYDPLSSTGFTSVTNPPPSGNLVMAMGCDYDYQDYVFDSDSDYFEFIYAVGCTYAVSAANKAQRFTPEYRIPQHMKKAASEVSIEIISNDLVAGDNQSSADFEIHIVDRSHGVEVGENLDQMLAQSNVDDICIEVPGVTLNSIVLDGNNPASGTGHDPSNPLIYNGTITNEAAAPNGTYPGLVKVTDTYPPGLNESPLLNGTDGIERVDPLENPLTGLFEINEFVTYTTFEIDIETYNEPPVADLKPERFGTDMGNTVFYWGTDSYDPDGSIVQYEFDFELLDGDIANFEADVTNTTGEATSFRYLVPGSITAALRVTDDLGEIDYDTETVPIGSLDVIYVDDSNDSGTEDGTSANPFNTIQEGISAATSGYQVWVDDSGADYQGPVSLKTDVILRSINWDTSDGTEMASIYNGTTQAVVYSAPSATIDGFKIYGSQTMGMRINASYTTVKNCWITDIGKTGNERHVQGLSISSCYGVEILDCEVSEIELNYSGTELSSLNGALMYHAPTTFSGCTFHDMRVLDRGNLAGIYYAFTYPVSGYTSEVINTRVYNLHHDKNEPTRGLQFLNCDEIEVYNNLVYNISATTGGEPWGIGISSVPNISVVNNTVYDISNEGGSATGILVLTGCENFDGRNNIVGYINDGSGSLIGRGVVIYQSGVPWEYNNVFDFASGTPPSGTGNISADPLFVDELNSDFHLDTGSPCIDTGDPSIYDPDSSRSDMGAYGGPDGNW